MAKSRVPYIAELGDPTVQHQSVSRDVQKISNGYLITDTTCGPGNAYDCKRTFSETPPKTSPGAPNGPGESQTSLREAILALKGKSK